MPREGYDKSTRLYRSDRYKFISKQTKPRCMIAFGRVCDMKKTLTASTPPWLDGEQESEVWIDIFPFDHIPADEESHKREFQALNTFNIRLRRSYPRQQKGLTLKMRIKVMIKSLKRKMHKKAPHLAKIAGMIKNIIDISADSNSTQMAQLSMACSSSDKFTCEFLDDIQDIEFEGHRFMCVKGYDTMLRIEVR